MIQLQKDNGKLTVKYNGQVVIEHSHENPFLSVGKGKASYEMHHGNFTIEDNLQEKLVLTEYEILSEASDSVVITFSKNNNYPVEISFKDREGRLIIEFVKKPEGFNRSWIRLKAFADEHIYGCGEQFSELDLKGKKLPLWTSEQGVGRNKKDIITFKADVEDNSGGDWYTTYYPQPTFVSNKNYWCHVEDSHYMEFDFRNANYHELCIWNLPAKIIFTKKETAIKTLEDLTAYLGRQPELPDWTYNGVWLGVQGGTKTVTEKLETAQKYGVKVAALWCQDWEGKRITEFGKQLFWNWKYNEEMYPNLPHTIKELNEKGIKYLGYINTFLALEGDLYKEASAKGYVVKNPKGEDYHIEITTFPAAILDLTNPETVKWIKDVIKENMIDVGLSGWMCDFGEYLPTDAVLHSGESAESYHNKYPTEWAKVNREAVEEAGKVGEVVFFTRAGFTGTSRYSFIMWAGDQLVNWSLDDGLASVIPATLSLGMSGFGLCHSDIGGYTSLFGVVRTKELFMRWAEMAAFTPVMRTHEGNRPDDCWQFDSDEETLKHFAKMSNIYTHLKPYIKEIVRENALRGIPVQRHPYLHYEDDEELHKLKYQYLLGRDLMVAPVYEEKKVTHRVYLPADQWVHIWSGKEYGKGYHEVDAPLGQIPVFYRKGSKYEKLFQEIAEIE